MTNATWAVLAIFVPIVGAGLIAALGGRSSRARNVIAMGSSGLAAAASVAVLFGMGPTAVRVADWIPALGIPFDLRLDALGAFIAVIAGVLGFVVVVYSRGYMVHAAQQGYSVARYDALVLLFIGAMIGLALTDTLLAFYIFWEIVGLCSFALISFYHRDLAARHAGLKAFAVTRIGDIGLLVTVVLLWSSGIVTFTGLEAAGVPAGVLSLAALGVLVAAMGKSAQVPLHVWLPDAMEAPTPVSALIHAATMVNAGVYLLARTFPVFESIGWWTSALLWIGAASAVLGAVAALTERDLKRVLAYSTISQLGYMVAAIGAGAILASQFHLLSQAIFKALLFLAAGAVIQAAGTRDLFRMGGLRRAMPLTATGFLVGTIAMIGLPVANGFWSKDLLLEAVFEHGHLGPFLLLVTAAILTTAYSVRAYDLAFRGKLAATAKDPHVSMGASILVLSGAALVSGFLLGPFSEAMAATMPGHEVQAMSLLQALVLFARPPGALIIVSIVVLTGLLVMSRGWVARTRVEASSTYGRLVGSGFLIDGAFRRGADGIRLAAKAIRRTQTGDLNVNLAGLLAGLFIVLAILILEVI